MTIPGFGAWISGFAYDLLQDFDKLLDPFFGVVRGDADDLQPVSPNTSSSDSPAQLRR
jgi:hypothetical protein